MARLNKSFSEALIGLWLRLSTICSAALLIAFALLTFPGKVMGWLYYLSPLETVYELSVRAVALTVTGLILGGIFALVLAPAVAREGSRKRVGDAAIAVLSVLAAIADLSVALTVLGEWAHLGRPERMSAFAAFLCLVAVCVRNRTWRQKLQAQFNGMLRPRVTHGLLASAAAAVMVLILSAHFGPKSANAQSATTTHHPNILLVTFDAMAARDMSVYGYRLPTTPHLADLAQRSSVFDHFYSASTFTTPSLASILTGLAPSDTHVYHLPGRLRGQPANETFPGVLRDAGYTTAALLASPMAYYLASYQNRDFDILHGPVYGTHDVGAVWSATGILHPEQPFGARLDEYRDLENALQFLPSAFNSYALTWFPQDQSEFPPEEIFTRARELVRSLPDGYFLWVHCMAPHSPYLPKANMGRFLPTREMRTSEAQSAFSSGQTYTPDQQEIVDKDRLRYDEFMADADAAFGNFLAGLESDGKLKDTALIVSADHGESFEGGVFKHETRFQTASEIHIPLIVHLPGQTQSWRVSTAADETSLAPTILDMAGLPRAAWMKAPSLMRWIEKPPAASDAAAARGLAFTEYLETSSIFRPANSGTAGVTDGVHQYVYSLNTHKGSLRDANDPRLWNIDQSAEDPVDAQELRTELERRFPELFAH